MIDEFPASSAAGRRYCPRTVFDSEADAGCHRALQQRAVLADVQIAAEIEAAIKIIQEQQKAQAMV